MAVKYMQHPVLKSRYLEPTVDRLRNASAIIRVKSGGRKPLLDVLKCV
jgi:hypothetical protein